MIRLVLFTIILISFINVNYASFPVDNELTKISNQIHNIESDGKLNPLAYIIGGWSILFLWSFGVHKKLISGIRKNLQNSLENDKEKLKKVTRISLILGSIGIALMILQEIIWSNTPDYQKDLLGIKAYGLMGFLLFFSTLTYLVLKAIKKKWLKILCFILIFFLMGVTAPLLN